MIPKFYYLLLPTIFVTMNSRLLITLAVALLSFKSQAQVQFAYYAGVQATSALYKVNDVKQPTQFKPGFMAGMAAKVEFDNQLYFFPTVFYNLKGYKVKLNDPAFPPTEYAINNNVSIHTVEFAPLLHYDFNRQLAHFFVRFGPSVDVAIAGHEKFDTSGTSGKIGTVERPMNFAFTEYGRFTAQANLHFGYETGKGLMVYAYYQHGFGSMNNHDGGPKIFHRILGLSIGWLFGKNPLVMDTKPITK
jgi:hypothetical protein